ncbi:nitrilase/cyanide hydratase and apolipo protein N-acyltransferase [Atractiella rhizophila]|nr:nitrilase/cyanide hydratase and apolipo protein N-acyltransferase [Atractiella rhizophila]
MSKRVKVSVIQACTERYSISQTLEKLSRFVQEAATSGSSLCVFPEALIGGYPKYATFGTSVGTRTKEGRDEFLAYYKSSIAVAKDDATIQALENIARENNVFLIGGVIERDGGTLYCTAVFIDEKKGLVGKHRKLMPTASERLIWGQGGKDTLQAVSKQFSDHIPSEPTSLAAAICWENFMPLLRYHYYSQNIQIYAAPTVDQRPTWLPLMQTIAQEGRCFVLSACQFGLRSQWDTSSISMASAGSNDDQVIEGGSCIISPLGEVLAGPLRGTEGVLTVEVDLEDCIRGKYDFDVTGHYARPDIFELKAKL